MELLGIFLVIFVLLVLFYIYRYYLSDTVQLKTQFRGDELRAKIDYKNMGQSNDYTFSVWIYLQNWYPNTVKFELPVFQRMATDFKSVTEYPNFAEDDVTVEKYTKLRYSLTIGDLDSQQPILKARVMTAGGLSTCWFPPMPMQKWVNITTTIKGRVMDVYVDGKLIKAHPLPGPTVTNDAGSVFVLGNTETTFIHGRVSRLQYINKYITPKQAWSIYADGPDAQSFLSQFLNKYQLRILWLVDNEAKWQATL